MMVVFLRPFLDRMYIDLAKEGNDKVMIKRDTTKALLDSDVSCGKICPMLRRIANPSFREDELSRYLASNLAFQQLPEQQRQQIELILISVLHDPLLTKIHLRGLQCFNAAFEGSSFLDFLEANHLVKSRKEGEEVGHQLVDLQIVHHVVWLHH